jgi:hypothetical protein
LDLCLSVVTTSFHHVLQQKLSSIAIGLMLSHNKARYVVYPCIINLWPAVCICNHQKKHKGLHKRTRIGAFFLCCCFAFHRCPSATSGCLGSFLRHFAPFWRPRTTLTSTDKVKAPVVVFL